MSGAMAGSGPHDTRFVAEAPRDTPVYGTFDVAVCGGGSAGVAAAACAARKGASVLLIERYGYLGGLATGGLVITVPPMTNGINVEIRERLEAARSYMQGEHLGDDPSVDGLISIDPEVLKLELARIATEAGVRLLLHTYLVETIFEDGRIRGVIVENKAGRMAILAGAVVDATGDGDVAAAAGAGFEMEEDPLPVTLMSNMIGVDIDRVMARIGHWGNLRKLVADAVEHGDLEFELAVHSERWAPGVFAADLCYPGEINLWSGSMFGINGLDPDELTRAELVTREHTMRLAAWLKQNVPGFEDSKIEYTAGQVGVRETRRIHGGVTPNLKDCFRTRFADTVARPYAAREMRIAYRSLLPEAVEGLLVAGRCISATQDAMVQLRLVPVCFATGQAAGTAAAMAVAREVTPRALDVDLLQRDLSAQGMDLGPLPACAQAPAD
jgi:glycine/D-amino acid oxidase-like deaminating enzyme